MESFLSWKDGETMCIKVGTLRRVHNASTPRMWYRKRYIPVVYAQLLHQLCNEIAHGNLNPGDEAQRRAAYADQVTDQFADLIYGHFDFCRPGPAASIWRSKVLTPIIQRQCQETGESHTADTRPGHSCPNHTEKGDS